jgi:transposase
MSQHFLLTAAARTVSLLRSWLRPHRGISQEKLPYYLTLFEFVHNARCRGKALLGALLAALLPTTPKPE